MRPIACIALVVSLLGAPASGVAAVPTSLLAGVVPAEPPRALWVWHEPDRGLLPFARRHGIDRLYVHIPAGRATDDVYARLTERAAGAGIEIWATNGHADWATDPAPLRAWVREVRRARLYDGIVLDVEPHLLDAWDTDREAVQRSFLAALGIASRAAGKLSVVAAVPFWFDHDNQRLDGRTLLARAITRVDGVIVMAYRDAAGGSDGILRLVGGELAQGALRSRSVIVGVQTARDALDKLTFFEEGAAALESELDAVIEALRGAPAFDGIAIHHYDAYRALRR